MGLGLVAVREFFLKPTQKKDRPRYRVADPFNFKSSLVRFALLLKPFVKQRTHRPVFVDPLDSRTNQWADGYLLNLGNLLFFWQTNRIGYDNFFNRCRC